MVTTTLTTLPCTIVIPKGSVSTYTDTKILVNVYNPNRTISTTANAATSIQQSSISSNGSINISVALPIDGIHRVEVYKTSKDDMDDTTVTSNVGTLTLIKRFSINKITSATSAVV